MSAERTDIAPQDLKTRLDRKDPVVLLDVREDWETALCRLDNATHIPIEEIELLIHFGQAIAETLENSASLRPLGRPACPVGEEVSIEQHCIGMAGIGRLSHAKPGSGGVAADDAPGNPPGGEDVKRLRVTTLCGCKQQVGSFRVPTRRDELLDLGCLRRHRAPALP